MTDSNIDLIDKAHSQLDLITAIGDLLSIADPDKYGELEHDTIFTLAERLVSASRDIEKGFEAYSNRYTELLAVLEDDHDN